MLGKGILGLRASIIEDTTSTITAMLPFLYGLLQPLSGVTSGCSDGFFQGGRCPLWRVVLSRPVHG
ncbi:MAG: hypothetical protein OXE59_06100 [Bacteroidetes bacterium]|nr:hypothetical protein [Bacteroidota bacterium]MCY4233296.1 hypothetical protein [Bacteroidota bacterium]